MLRFAFLACLAACATQTDDTEFTQTITSTWTLTKNGAPTTCAALGISHMVVEYSGPGRTHCGSEPRSCYGDYFEPPCSDGAFATSFIGGTPSDEYSVRLTFDFADNPASRTVVQASTFDQGNEMPFTVDFR